MMHIAWSSIEEVPYCFSRSSIKFEGHTGHKIIYFDLDWAFPDNSSLISLMAMKCCTKLQVAWKRCPISSSVKYQGHTVQKINNFYPNWAFPDCNSSLNSLMALNDAQSLMPYRKCALLFFEVIHQISRSHRSKNPNLNPIWVRLLVQDQFQVFYFSKDTKDTLTLHVHII